MPSPEKRAPFGSLTVGTDSATDVSSLTDHRDGFRASSLLLDTEVEDVVVDSRPRRLGQNARSSIGRSSASGSLHGSTSAGNRPSVPTSLTLATLNLSDIAFVGREGEVQNLRETFKRAAAEGNDASNKKDCFPEVAMVHGYSGVGKTRLIDAALSKESNKIYLQGKFDSQCRATPYTAFVSAFSGLAAQIQANSNGHMIREAVIDAVGKDAALLINIIPSLAEVLGSDNSSDDSNDATTCVEGGIEDLNRLQFVFRTFVGAIGGSIAGCPVVVFLDDLQWADDASLKLLESLGTCRNMKSTFVIGTYRANEVDKDHNLSKILEAIKAKKEFVDITLDNLSSADMNCLVGTILRMEEENVTELSNIVEAKTDGNVFFAISFIQALREEGLLNFNLGSFMWNWDAEKIRSKFPVTANVADLMKRKLLALPVQMQNILQIACCLGGAFDQRTLDLSVDALSFEGEDSSDRNLTIAEALDEAVNVGLLQRNGPTYIFVHDQIQQAVFALIPEEQRDSFQAKVGRCIIDNAEPHDLESLLLVAVDLCNCDTSAFSNSVVEKVRLANFNLEAGMYSIKQAAFVAAGQYLDIGLNVLQDVPFEDTQELQIKLNRYASQAHYSSGSFERMDVCLDSILNRTDLDIMDKLPLYMIRCHALYASYKLTESLELSQQVLVEMGYKRFPDEASTYAVVKDLVKTKVLLKKHAGKIPQLPLMQDEKRIYAMRLYHTIGSTMYMLGSSVLPILILRWTRWVLKYGLTGHSCTAIVFYAFMITSMGDLEGGREYGEICEQMLKRLEPGDAIGRCLFSLQHNIKHWTMPINLCIKPSLDAHEVAMRVGDTESAMWDLWSVAHFSLCSGRRLVDVEDMLRSYMLSCREYNLEGVWATMAIYRQQILKLMGRNGDPLVLTGDVIDQEEHLTWARGENMQMVITVLYNVRIEQAYYFHEYKEAASMLDCCLPGEKTYPGAFVLVRNSLFEGLVCFAMAKIEGSKKWLKRGSAVLKKISKWLKAGNVNCTHIALLLTAERAFAKGNMTVAQTKYGEAIAIATRSGLVQDRALAHERTCCFYMQKNDRYWAKFHLDKAMKAYGEWEAHAKVDHLQNIFHELFAA